VPLEAGGFPLRIDESDYRYPPEGVFAMMTFEQKVARLDELAAEVRSLMADVPGLDSAHFTSKNESFSLTFKSIDDLKTYIPADKVREHGPNSLYGGEWSIWANATIGNTSCYATDKVEVQVVRKVAEATA
jgi:hypothetical protein